MVEYDCPRCGHNTKHRSHMKSHVNRKKICKPILADIELNEYSEKILKSEDSGINCSHCDKKFFYKF